MPKWTKHLTDQGYFYSICSESGCIDIPIFMGEEIANKVLNALNASDPEPGAAVVSPAEALLSCPFCGEEQTGDYLKHHLDCYIRRMGTKYTDVKYKETFNTRAEARQNGIQMPTIDELFTKEEKQKMVEISKTHPQTAWARIVGETRNKIWNYLKL